MADRAYTVRAPFTAAGSYHARGAVVPMSERAAARYINSGHLVPQADPAQARPAAPAKGRARVKAETPDE